MLFCKIIKLLFWNPAENETQSNENARNLYDRIVSQTPDKTVVMLEWPLERIFRAKEMVQSQRIHENRNERQRKRTESSSHVGVNFRKDHFDCFPPESIPIFMLFTRYFVRLSQRFTVTNRKHLQQEDWDFQAHRMPLELRDIVADS